MALMPVLKNLREDPDICSCFISFEFSATSPAKLKEQTALVEQILQGAHEKYGVLVKPMGSRYLVVAHGKKGEYSAPGVLQKKQNAQALLMTMAELAQAIKSHNSKPFTLPIRFSAGIDSGKAWLCRSLLEDSYPTDAFGDAINRTARVEELALPHKKIIFTEAFAKLLQRLGYGNFIERFGTENLRGHEESPENLFELPEHILDHLKSGPLKTEMLSAKASIQRQVGALALSRQMSSGYIVTFDLAGSSKLAKELGDRDFTTALLVAQTRARTVFEKYADAAIIEFIGDAIVARFVPVDGNPAINAIMAAREFLAELEKLQADRLLPPMPMRCAISALKNMYIDGRTTIHTDLEKAKHEEKYGQAGLIRLDSDTRLALKHSGLDEAFSFEESPAEGFLLVSLDVDRVENLSQQNTLMPLNIRQAQIDSLAKNISSPGVCVHILDRVEEGQAFVAALHKKIKEDGTPAQFLSANTSGWSPDPLKSALQQLIFGNEDTALTPQEKEEHLRYFLKQNRIRDDSSRHVLGIYLGLSLQNHLTEQYWKSDPVRFENELKGILTSLFKKLAEQQNIVLTLGPTDPDSDSNTKLKLLSEILAHCKNQLSHGITVLILSQDRNKALKILKNGFDKLDAKVLALDPLTRSQSRDFFLEVLRQQHPRSQIQTAPAGAFEEIFGRAQISQDDPQMELADPYLMYLLTLTYLRWDEENQRWFSLLNHSRSSVQSFPSLTDDSLDGDLSSTSTSSLTSFSSSLETAAVDTDSPLGRILDARIRQLEKEYNRQSRNHKTFRSVLNALAILGAANPCVNTRDLERLLIVTHPDLRWAEINDVLLFLKQHRILSRKISSSEISLIPQQLATVVQHQMDPDEGLRFHHTQIRHLQHLLNDTKISLDSQDHSLQAQLGSHLKQFGHFSRQEAGTENYHDEAVLAFLKAAEWAEKKYDSLAALSYLDQAQEILSQSSLAKSLAIEILFMRHEIYRRTRLSAEEWRETIDSIKTILEKDHNLSDSQWLRAILAVFDYLLTINDKKFLEWIHHWQLFVEKSSSLRLAEKANYYANLAHAFSQSGKTDLAAKNYEQAWNFAKQSGDTDLESQILFRHTNFYLKNGELKRARDLAEQVLPLLRNGKDLATLGKMLVTLNVILGKLSVRESDPEKSIEMIKKAVDYLKEALKIAVKTHDSETFGDAEVSLGVKLALLGRFDEACSHIRSALEQAKLMQDSRLELLCHKQLAVISRDPLESHEHLIQLRKLVKAGSRD